MNRILILFVALLLMSISIKTVAQSKNQNSMEDIQISQNLFDKIEKWQLLGDKQEVPLDEYLRKGLKENQSVNNEIVNLINKLTESKGQTRGTECNCTMLSVNSSYDIANYDSGEIILDEDGDGLSAWYRKGAYGAATSQRLFLNSVTNNEFEFGESMSGTEYSSNNFARLSFNYLCTNGYLLPENCGCAKIIDIRSSYYNFSSVKTAAHGGWGTHSSFAAIEDDMALFTIDQYLDNTEITVLAGGQYQLSRAQDDTWNPEFWTNIVGLSSSIAGFALDDDDIDWSDAIEDVGGQIIDVFNTPVDIHNEEEEDGIEFGDYTVDYDGGITLNPNHIVKIVMISKGHIYGKGKGKFVSESQHKSDYFISAVLPLNDSSPECCLEKMAKWVSGSYDVVGYENLRNSIASEVTLWAPWDDLSDIDLDGNVDISNNIGFVNQNGDCVECGRIVNGLRSETAGVDFDAGTRTINFFWNGQMFVFEYIVKVYDEFGTLIDTINTTNTTTSIDLPPGNYSFEVIAICEDGTQSESNSYSFTVPNLFETGDGGGFTIAPNPFNDTTVIYVENFENYSNVSIEIVDIHGVVYFNNQISSSQQQINTRNWPIGMYFCTVNLDGSQSLKQIVKTK